MEISELTGLPELPEDHIWVVSESRGTNYMGVRTGEIGTKVTIVKTVSILKMKDRMIRLPFGMEFAWGYEAVLEESREDVMSMEIRKTEILTKPKFKIDGEKDGTKEVEEEVKVMSYELTPELILNAAQKCLTRWEERKRALSYLGDYPPKTLKEN